jgi:lipoprotein-anchoring transpeptidase ErfK/SrfK
MPRHLLAGLAATAFGLLAIGCSTGAESEARDGDEAATAEDPNLSVVAEAAVPEVAVFAEPGGAGEPIHLLANPTAVGGPLVFLVDEDQGEWLEVLLPLRPNGSTGWIRASDVSLSSHTFHIDVSLSTLTITVFEGDEVIVQEPVGIGTGETPTPGGRYYLKELLQPSNPNGAYGPFAYGLSGFSDQLTSFAGGDGVIGLHGTNDPSSIGQRVSHGCIRMSNEGITFLAGILPLGVPIEILP